MARKLSKKKDKKTKLDRTHLTRLLLLVAEAMALLAFYRFAMQTPWFMIVMIAYMAALTVLLFVYFLYNRCFARRNVTPEMLPVQWSEEEKTAWIEDGKRRLAKSRWMLMLILAIGFTFAFDAMELFVLPIFQNIF